MHKLSEKSNVGKISLSIFILTLIFYKNVNDLLSHEAKIVDLKEVNLLRFRSASRYPASREDSIKIPSEVLTLDLGCRKPSNVDSSLSTVKEYIQFKGRVCHALLQNEERVRVENLTNGSEGIYFIFNQDEYYTDLIRLDNGPNQIQITSEQTTDEMPSVFKITIQKGF